MIRRSRAPLHRATCPRNKSTPQFGGFPTRQWAGWTWVFPPRPSLLSRRAHCRGLELVTRCLQPGIAKEMTGSPKFLGNLNHSVCTCSKPTPAGLLAPDQKKSAAAWLLVIKRQRLPRQVFRRSIASLSDSLSTLRRGRCLPRRKTRFQLLVRLYWAGFSPARFR